MAQLRITEPDGTRWTVGRRWLPWKPRLRKAWDVLDAFDTLDVIGLLFAITVGVVLVLVLGVVILVAELVAAFLFVIGVLFLHFVLGRPWTIEARSEDDRRIRKKIAGWRDSGEEVERIAQRIAAGDANRVQAEAQLVEA